MTQVTSLKQLESLRTTSAEPFVATVPGSKSYTNRALILAAQRMGTTSVVNALASDDTRYLAVAIGAFHGVDVQETETGFITARTEQHLHAPDTPLFMGGAGTPARFLLSFAAAARGATAVTGNPRLEERPMKDVLDTLSSEGIRIERLGQPGHLPVRVHGGAIVGRDWTVRGDVSSQFTSSLCLLAAQQDGDAVRIHIEGNQVSKPYVDMTLAMLNECGIFAARTDGATIEIKPSRPSVDSIRVEVDASGMSYFLAAAAVTQTTVEIPGIGKGSAQGDVGLAAALERMGCRVEVAADRIRITGRPLKGIDIDMETMPDVVLTLAAVASLADGPTRIHNIANLRLKECDRINAAARELERLGVQVEEGTDYLVVEPGGKLSPAKIRTYDDHRVAMAFAVLGLVTDGIEIEDPDCVSKSFPTFWNELDRFCRHHGRGVSQ